MVSSRSARARILARYRTRRSALWHFAFGFPLFLLALGLMAAVARAEETTISHAYCTIGEPKYPADFPHLEYVNPDAPKGGEISFATVGTFNSMVPFSRDGRPGTLSSIGIEDLMGSVSDDPNCSYGLLAESIEYPESQDWVIFKIRDEARFADGTPITADDAVFTWELFMEQGLLSYRQFLGQRVSKVEAIDEMRVKYTFAEGIPREGFLSQMGANPVMSRAWFEETGARLDRGDLTPIMGSGPYVLESVDPGRQIIYARNPDYWGADLPLQRGRSNFDRIRIEYFGDANAALEAFKSGAISFRQETSSRIWATQYNFPAISRGWVRQEELPNGALAPMNGFVFNLGREHLQDVRVREAISLMYNFTWTNETLQYGLFNQISSFWQNTDLGAEGVAEGAELELLQSMGDMIDPALLTEPVVMPHESGERKIDRRNLRRAMQLMNEAGWTVGSDGMMRNEQGQTFDLEFLEDTPEFDRIITPYIDNLKALGINATYNRVDPAQFTNRRRDRDYDVVFGPFYPTAYGPGLGYKQRFGSEDAEYSLFNPAGFANEAADRIMDRMLVSKTTEEFRAGTKALDRLMRAERFVIPTWYNPNHWVAFYDMYEYPDPLPPLALGFLDFWWYNAEKAEALRAAGAFQ